MEDLDKVSSLPEAVSPISSGGDNPTESSCSRSSSPSLRNAVSGINISGSGSPLNSQLEQLANTNLLTIRVSIKNHIEDSNKSNWLISTDLEDIIYHFKGTVVGEDHIEPYEFLPDYKRLKILQDEKDVYIFESGNVEFARSYTDDDTSAAWNYDSVLQVQFKRSNILLTVANEVQKQLESHEELIDKWSISTCSRALTQPGNLYVRGIPKNLTMDQIFPIFSKFGPISSLKIICDDVTGDSLGYGFLSYPLGSQASLCIHDLNGKTYENSTLFVNYHIERKERERIYRDNIKESNHDEKFKSIFIGNIPVSDEEKEPITPESILELLKTKLETGFSDFKIVSFYFPKRNDSDGSDSKDNGDDSGPDHLLLNVDKSPTNSHENLPNEETKFRNYGFIKFANHEQALKAIEIFDNYNWHGTTLIANKAVQNKSQNSHPRSYNDKTSSGGSSGYRARHRMYSFGNSPTSNPFGYFNGSGNVFFPYMNSQGTIHNMQKGNNRQDVDPLYGMGQTMNTAAFINPFQIYGGLPSTNSTQSTFDGSSPGGSLYTVNPYSMMSSNTPVALPLPAKDQQESNLYVKHLPLNWKDKQFHEFYEKYGEIISAKIITVGGSKNKENKENKENNGGAQAASDENDSKQISVGSSRGYGFVCFKNPLDASRAILSTDGFRLTASHTLSVSFAQKRAKSVATQGGQSWRNSSTQSFDHMSAVQSNLKNSGRSHSHTDNSGHNFESKYMAGARHQGGVTSGRHYSPSFLHSNGNWAALSVMPNVAPGMPGVPFMPPNPSSMMGSYVMQPAQMSNQTSDDH